MNKKYYLNSICIFFTFLTLAKILLEWIFLDNLDKTGSNLLLAFLFICISIFVLSRYPKFDRFSPLFVIIVQYIIVMLLILGIVWFSGQFTKLSNHAYRDVFISSTVPYVIGAVWYYVELHLEIKKENKMLANIKAKH